MRARKLRCLFDGKLPVHFFQSHPLATAEGNHAQLFLRVAATDSIRPLGELGCRFNENARKVASFLAGHRGVARVFFNGLKVHRSYETARRLLRGPGSVISFTLAHDTWEGLRVDPFGALAACRESVWLRATISRISRTACSSSLPPKITSSTTITNKGSGASLGSDCGWIKFS